MTAYSYSRLYTMRIWLLTRTDRIDYEEVAGGIVIAGDEDTARQLIAGSAGGEGADRWHRRDLVSCRAIGDAYADDAEIVLLDEVEV